MSSKITLPADTPFVECYQSLNSEWRSCTHLGRLATKREGEFIRTPDDPQFAASFSSPTTKDCIGPGVDVVSSCDIQIKFTNEQVLKLQEENVIPSASTLPPLPPITNKESLGSSIVVSEDDSQSSVQNQSGLGTEPSSPIERSVEFLSDNSVFLIPVLVFLFLIIFFRDKLKYILFSDDRTKRPNQPRRALSTGSTPPSSSTFDSLESSNITYQLDSMSQKLKSVDSKLSDIEMRLLDLEQRSVSKPGRSFSSQSGVVASSSGDLLNLQPAPSPAASPSPLSIDLVKQAVAQADYSLIASHSHLFLNETQESRQGKFERKRFDVLGDQSQSSSFANAEFIAITVASQTFLIPNILPNAADPRRTMKRHVDSNSIYRSGAGSNILRIDTLATLQQLSTASYELAQLGSIE